MSIIDDLICVVRAFAASKRLAEATVSARFLGRGARLDDLAKGGDMGARTAQRALEKFSDEWPEGVEWPAHVERPLPAEAAR